MPSIYEFTDYKSYLRKSLDDLGKTQRGVRSRFAESVGCRSGYVTQVLNGKADLSLEQVDLASSFLGHTDEEAEFFLLIVIYGRSKTKQLRERIGKQLERSLEQRLVLKKRFKVDSISSEAQTIFYSSWHYLAVLTLLSVPKLQSKDAVSRHLGIPLKLVSEIFETLEGAGLIMQKAGKYVPGTTRTHLGEDSPMTPRHHINWRIQAIQAIEKRREHGLHYSSVVSLSEKDARKVKQILVEALEGAAKVIAPSPEEKVCSLCIDFFDV